MSASSELATCGSFIAVDWGSTNRRAYLVAADGSVADRFEDECGIGAVAPRRVCARA